MRRVIGLFLLVCAALLGVSGGGSGSAAPSWEVALEELLGGFLPIFTPGPPGQVDWSIWDVGGATHFVTGESIDADAPFILTRQFDTEHGAVTETYIATGFSLHDLDGGGVPVLLIRWHIIDGLPHEGISMFRYQGGEYAPVPVLIRPFWQDEYLSTPFLFTRDIFGGSELLARDCQGRLLTLGIGGAGGFGTWAHVLHIEGEIARLEPFFNIRFDFGPYGEQLRLYADESITGPIELLPEIGPEDALFFPWEWEQGGGDLTPVAIPIMPEVTVEPFPRMTELEERVRARFARPAQ